jgi:uncharacterized protein (TIGR04255 family)
MLRQAHAADKITWFTWILKVAETGDPLLSDHGRESDDLPEFQRPPVVEVAVGLQFTRVSGLRGAHLGIFYEQLRATGFQLATIEEFPTLSPVLEAFSPVPGDPPFRIEVLNAPPLPRTIFTSTDSSLVIQLQNDRFICGWRKGDTGEAYPRFRAVADRFHSIWGMFQSFIVKDIGEPSPQVTQIEIAYVNDVFAAGTTGAQLGDLVRMWRPVEDAALPKFESAEFLQKHVISDDDGPYARLHIAAAPASHDEDNVGIRLTLTFRGAPRGEGDNAVGAFINAAHEKIVRAFAAVTTEQMHVLWGRK